MIKLKNYIFTTKNAKRIIVYRGGGAPEGQIHFIANTRFSNEDFFQNITEINPNYDFSNLEVYINGELTNQVANSITADRDDDVIIKSTDGYYPWFSDVHLVFMRGGYIKSIEEPLPLMHQADGSPITSFAQYFYECESLTSIPEGLFDNNTQATDFSRCFERCEHLTSIPIGLFDKNIQATDFSRCFSECSDLTVNVQIGSIASSVDVSRFAYRTNGNVTVYCRAGSAAYTAFSKDKNVNVLTY